MTRSLIDIGINLTHKSFRRDQKDVIQRAKDAKVSTLILTGTCESSSRAALELAQSYPEMMYSTAGVHPHDAKEWTPQTEAFINTLAMQDQVVAIGECGLDFNRDFSPRPKQEEVFERQIQLAIQHKKPLFLHERDAQQRFLDILTPYRDQLVDAVVHCFTGTKKTLTAYIDLDLHIGITGWICDERRGTHLRQIVSLIPQNRLMIETDAPFLTPRDLRPKPAKGRNEPAFLPHILQHVATCRNEPLDEVAEATTKNAQRFFRLPS
ncbi:MAG TPA: hydrolase TatD [Myxococcales bacterium]|nr:hydrolase TatD [Deltaproteobacteria bacterium]HAA56566.1 hydrolase TatD [Myxococcales bacterium]|tara:strand:- start:11594 stop:12391 length:798 start_codon:yes stop_codon:yes gene_type:complete